MATCLFIARDANDISNIKTVQVEHNQRNLSKVLKCDFVTARLGPNNMGAAFYNEISAGGDLPLNEVASEICKCDLYGDVVICKLNKYHDVESLVTDCYPLTYWVEDKAIALKSLFHP